MTKYSWTQAFFVVTGILGAPSALYAATYFSGTGFVVSRQGETVTNAHVVENCVTLQVRTTDGQFLPAQLKNRDATADLALLSTSLQPDRPARLRNASAGVQVRERVMLMGYPQDAVREGKYKVATSSVRALTGLTGESDWLQFEDSVRMGNSGGPLLDYAANVVGVVTGKATLVKRNTLAARDEIVGKSDFAINLAALRRFLDKNRVRYESRDSLMKLSPAQVETAGKEFIVNVLCEQQAPRR